MTCEPFERIGDSGWATWGAATRCVRCRQHFIESRKSSGENEQHDSLENEATTTTAAHETPTTCHCLDEACDCELAALDQIAGTSKSLLIALAVARGRMDAATAIAAARVAETHQTDEWGVVEAGHDLDAANVAVSIASASAFLRMIGK